eukprot:157776-Chlamydomonas_euryale.AAC.2
MGLEQRGQQGNQWECASPVLPDLQHLKGKRGNTSAYKTSSACVTTALENNTIEATPQLSRHARNAFEFENSRQVSCSPGQGTSGRILLATK